MKTLITAAISTVALCATTFAQSKNTPYLSLKLEMERAIKTGNDYMKSKQTKEGYWKEQTVPAFTALAVTAAMRDPNRADEKTPEYLESAYTWLLSKQKADGGIYGKGLASYNTSTSVMALAASGSEAHHPAILKARKFLINQQTDWDTKGETDNPMDGGAGYGGSYPHSDMSNTYLTIEALELSKHIAEDSKHGKQPDLDWEAAIQFISRCQNLEKTNDQPGIGNDGGMVYFPGNSKAGTETLPDGRTALRSYGSMSYAGLLSFIYADLDHDDIRVKAVKQWLSDNYTIEENPGLGQQGLYYYYHVMAKALTAANIDTLQTKGGKQVDWRSALATRILSAQREDGSWVNANSRWWENEPELVTTFAVLTLQQIYYSIPEPAAR